jgi:hypothetical protein
MDGSRPNGLDLPDHGVKTKQGDHGPEVFDPWRRRWVALTPEEWVRQHFLNHLVHDLGYPAGRIAVETSLVLNGLRKRADAVVYGRDGLPRLLVECKAPDVPITQAVFEQAARYNLVHRVGLLVVTNGRRHFCCAIDLQAGISRFLPSIPPYSEVDAPPDHGSPAPL